MNIDTSKTTYKNTLLGVKLKFLIVNILLSENDKSSEIKNN